MFVAFKLQSSRDFHALALKLFSFLSKCLKLYTVTQCGNSVGLRIAERWSEYKSERLEPSTAAIREVHTMSSLEKLNSRH